MLLIPYNLTKSHITALFLGFVVVVLLLTTAGTTFAGAATLNKKPTPRAGNATQPAVAPTIPSLRLNASPRARYQILSCSVDTATKENPTYYHLPEVNTVIRCRQGGAQRDMMLIGTLHDFYNEGWRLISVINIDSRLLTKDDTVPYSWLYLERRL